MKTLLTAQRVLICVLGILMASVPADARRIPTVPATLTDADRREILQILDVDDQRVRALNGFRTLVTAETTQPWTQAFVVAAQESLAPGIESVRRVTCVKKDGEGMPWTCNPDHPGQFLYAMLPEECKAKAHTENGGPYLSVVYDKVSLLEIAAAVDLICTSDTMDEKAWSKGFTVVYLRRSVDGELEVFTEDPNSRERGQVFQLDGSCDKGGCQFTVRRTGEWRT